MKFFHTHHNIIMLCPQQLYMLIVRHYNNIMNDVLMCIYSDLITQRLQYDFYSVFTCISSKYLEKIYFERFHFFLNLKTIENVLFYIICNNENKTIYFFSAKHIFLISYFNTIYKLKFRRVIYELKVFKV